MGPSKVKALCVATRCTSAEQFISTFHRFSDETSFFVATLNQRPIGLETAFSIQLADRSPVLRGTCVVLDAWPTADNPYRRPGVRLGVRRLTPESETVFKRLQEARAKGDVTAETQMEPFSETPVALLPSIPSAPNVAPRVAPITRTATGSQRKLPRAGSVVAPTAMIPPKTPPEASVLEVILPIVADSPSEAMALPVEVDPPAETRTPGSDFILPANPLMNLTDESLEGFVDCTLYEDHSNFANDYDVHQIVPAIPLLAGDEHVLVAAPRTGNTIPPPMRRTGNTIPPMLRLDNNVLREEPSVVTMMPTAPAPVALRVRTGNTIPPVVRMDQSGMLRVDTPTGQSEPLRLETQSGHSGMLRLESSGMLRLENESGQSGLLRVDGVSGMLRVDPIGSTGPGPGPAMAMPPPFPMHGQPLPFPTASPPTPKFFGDEMVRTPVPAGEAFVAPPRHRATSQMSTVSALLSRRVLIAGGAAAASLIVVLIIATRGGSSSADATRNAVTAPPPPPTAPVAKPTPPPPPAVDTPVSKEPDPDPSTENAVVVGDGPCKLEVTTSPAGTMVSLDGRPIGPSPLTVAGTCERHTVDLAHPRYKAEQKVVALEEGKPATLDVTLVRPTHSLKILTSPPGAEVFIGGRRAGTSPTLVQINGFSGIDVRIERVGFKTQTKRVYSKTPEDKLFFSLDPLPRPK